MCRRRSFSCSLVQPDTSGYAGEIVSFRRLPGGCEPMWKRAVDILVMLCRFAAGVAFAVLMFAVIVQVLGRSVFASSPVWTEELTRFALLYLVAFGAGLSYRNGEMVNVDLVCESLPGRVPWVLRLVSAGLTVFVCVMLLGPALHYTRIGAMQTSPALGWPMHTIHASILVLLVLVGVFAAMRIIGMLTGRSDGLPHYRQDDAS